MEITQFTYFQQVGGIDVKPVSAEITYGLERLTMYIQGVDNIYDLKWDGNLTYGEVYKQFEYEHSKYVFEMADVQFLRAFFDGCEKEALRCMDEGLVLPGYAYVLKC